jgi:IS4 transposase
MAATIDIKTLTPDPSE